jgi:glycosyltransferase 2 family protein
MHSGKPDSGGSGWRAHLPERVAGGWRFYAGLAFSLAALALAFRDVDLAGVGSAIGAADWRILGLALVSYLLTVMFKAARWQLLLSLRTASSLSRSFSVLSIGLLVNALVPARLGELVRAYLMGESTAQSKAFVLGTVAVEKILELLSLVLAVALLISQVVLPEWLIMPVQTSALILAGLCAGVALLAWRRNLLMRPLTWLAGRGVAGWSTWLARQTEQGLGSLDVLHKPGVVLGLVLWSLVILIVGASTNYLVCAALGLALPIWAALFMLVVLQVGVAVPSSPGKIGVFHYLTVLALSVFGVPREAALGCGIVLHLVVYLPTVLIGVYCLWRESLPWQKLTEAASRLKSAVQGTP